MQQCYEPARKKVFITMGPAYVMVEDLIAKAFLKAGAAMKCGCAPKRWLERAAQQLLQELGEDGHS